MSSVEASRAHLNTLYKKVCQAEGAVKKAGEEEYGVREREEERRRRLWDDSDDEDDEWAIAQVARDREQYPDEQEDGFDFEAKQKRLEDELQKAIWEATEAYRAFVAKFEACVKEDSLGSLAELHDMMHSKLPVELRDMIYWHLTVRVRQRACYPTRPGPIYVHQETYDPNFHSYRGAATDSEYKTALMIFEDGNTDSLKPGGWLLNPEFVGRGMAREIAERFYAVKDFSVHVYQLEEFLFSDRTGTGFKPCDYIRGHISVYVPTTFCNGKTERAWQNTENEVAFLNGLYTQLSHLMRLAHKSRLTIEIQVTTSAPLRIKYEQGERRFYNIMESVRAPIYDLIHAGANVIVKHTKVSSSTTRNISEEPMNYFRMNKEAWEAERKTHGPDWMPSISFIAREELEDEDEGRRSIAERRLREALEQRWGHLHSIDAYGSR
ncbi:uncharacterized protein CC84DRAFT_1167100 [Paraphaeosphaeria sporulosa]|uniref:Uncharacterized protein n=1 Tax=Paraphaeosphaeria sporulosa TaxID=1460663 RepID=A0A177C3E2_9PLEO|nr:uncharacterized protein CC84DRAFT_1167100 [Paraphaeosphaeria sporulosa]OAG01916.1 hypothetical protein CC84DRAFT_1167100 [Paraphaeosphaeria sporulosa]